MSEQVSAISSSDRRGVEALLDEFRPMLSDVAKGSIQKVGMYGCALRAAIAKSFEFAVLVHRNPSVDHGFFLTSTLRGICEDLIVLSFIAPLSPSERNEVVSLLMAKNIADGIAAQSVFFKSMRPWQPVLQPLLETSTDTELRLRILAKSRGWTGRQPWPTVWFMANASSLAPLYSYIYAATSKWVHFSPHILMRMGWGGTLGSVSDETEWSFTTNSFVQYYTEFNQVYALMLFLQLAQGPATDIFPPDAAFIISTLKSLLDGVLRWPEGITFEEMNLQAPGSIQRILLRSAHENGNANPKSL